MAVVLLRGTRSYATLQYIGADTICLAQLKIKHIIDCGFSPCVMQTAIRPINRSWLWKSRWHIHWYLVRKHASTLFNSYTTWLQS